MRKRAQPSRMEETLDGDRMLGLMERYMRGGGTERAMALAEIVDGVELLFSSPQKKLRFKCLKKQQLHAINAHKWGNAAA